MKLSDEMKVLSQRLDGYEAELGILRKKHREELEEVGATLGLLAARYKAERDDARQQRDALESNQRTKRDEESERLRVAFDEMVVGLDLSKPKNQRDHSQTDGINHYLDLQYLRDALKGKAE